MSKKLLLTPLFLAFAGCNWLSPNLASTGWRFEIGTPSVMASPGVIQQTSGTIAAMPFAGGPAGVTLVPSQSATGPVVASLPMPRLAETAPSGGCTMEDVCKKLDDIARRLPVKP